MKLLLVNDESEEFYWGKPTDVEIRHRLAINTMEDKISLCKRLMT